MSTQQDLTNGVLWGVASSTTVGGLRNLLENNLRLKKLHVLVCVEHLLCLWHSVIILVGLWNTRDPFALGLCEPVTYETFDDEIHITTQKSRDAGKSCNVYIIINASLTKPLDVM